jgi:uncharacterized RDD family membrane protein YckC
VRVFCPNCGTENSNVARFCRNCGATLPVRGGDADLPGLGGVAAAPAVQYGGFWIRFVAALIDGVVLGVISGIVGALLGRGAAGQGLSSLLGLAVGWLYEAYLESSERQATLGKMALGLKVTDETGNRISFARATGRHFAKYISAIPLLLGFIWAAFDSRKQGWHDKLAGTLVVRAKR